MSFEIQGKIIHKYPVTDVTPSFKKREFVIEHTESVNGREFTDYIRFQLTQERCSLIEDIDNGSQIVVTFRIKGRKWEKDGEPIYFTNLEAFRVQQSKLSARADTRIPEPEEPLESLLPDGDDLPF